MKNTYDYIITGAGCAGLSLLMRMLQEPLLQQKRILVIDQFPKDKNDRTWCFWEKGTGLFESIVHHQWEELDFLSPSYHATMPIAPYKYKMIQGIHFYNHVINAASKFKQVEFVYEKVTAIVNEAERVVVETEHRQFYANYVFNSILFEKPILQKSDYYLLQHFKGWLIQTSTPSFDANKATFMDFSVSQEHGTTFMYVLPTSPTTALVEYTLFTEQLLAAEAYTTALKEYISHTLQLEDYTIEHEEFGIIPMTNFRFPTRKGNIVYMGIAGGKAKGSSGYAFQFIQKQTAAIVASLVTNQHPFVTESLSDKKFHLYDSVLLHVLHYNKMPGWKIFADIFQKNKPATVFDFLDNNSNLLQDIQIMRSVPTSIFLPAAFKEMF